jgi:membrane protein required for colicin V production
MSEMPFADLVILTVLAITIGRGLWIGLIREGLSIAAIGVATIVTRLSIDPLSAWVTEITAGEVAGRTAVWVAGVSLVISTILIVGLIARFLRRGAQFAGLGWADRLGGGALGFAEGAVVSTILVLIAVWLVGPTHPALAGSRSLATLERIQSLDEVQDLQNLGDHFELPNVAAPGSD